jgi:hypothetical protein
MTTAPDAMQQLLIERACERVIVEFVHRLDLGDSGSVAELFTRDGVWEWPHDERRVEGREALRAYFASRPADRLSRRLMTNILVTAASSTEARATSYLTTFRVDGYPGSGFVPPPLPANVGHYDDTFRFVDGRWLIVHRSLFLAFGGPTDRVSTTSGS